MICESCKNRDECNWYNKYKDIKDKVIEFCDYKFSGFENNNELQEKLKSIIDSYNIMKCNNFVLDVTIFVPKNTKNINYTEWF